MNSIKGWIVSILLILLGALLAKQGVELWSLGTNVDGDGIGVHFLGLEINDRVPEASIPSYAIGFFVLSAITLLLTITVIGRRFLKSR
jgi:hypothetical protein